MFHHPQLAHCFESFPKCWLFIMIYRGIKILPLCTHLFPKQFLFLLITYYLLGIKQKSKFVQIFYPVLTCVPLFLLACHKINDIFIRHLHKEWFFMLFNTASLAQLHRFWVLGKYIEWTWRARKYVANSTHIRFTFQRWNNNIRL